MAGGGASQLLGFVDGSVQLEQADGVGPQRPILSFPGCLEGWFFAIIAVLSEGFGVLGVRLGQVVLVLLDSHLRAERLLFREKRLLRNFSNHQLYRLSAGTPK
jgi:hypothetical protein